MWGYIIAGVVILGNLVFFFLVGEKSLFHEKVWKILWQKRLLPQFPT